MLWILSVLTVDLQARGYAGFVIFSQGLTDFPGMETTALS